MTYDFDLFIIGAGPAGLAAAKQAAQYSVKVAIAEQSHLGGCCVNRGCIPKKLMVYAADYATTMRESVNYGWEGCANNFNWQYFQAKRDQELQRLRQLQQQTLEKLDVQLFKGHVCFLDAHTLNVDGQNYTADKILVAVGGKPIKLNIPGIEYCVTSDELLSLDQLPKRIVIIGGGYIGVEFSNTLKEFGCDITIVDRADNILEGFDDDLRDTVREELTRRGIRSFCQTTIAAIKQTPNGLCLHLQGNCPETLEADLVLCAVGRAPNLDALGLESADVKFDKQAIAVDDRNRTSQPHIYAVGDCTNRKQLTPVARAEGQAAVHAMFGQSTEVLDYQLIPSAVLTRPEIASIGLTETAAREQYGDAIQCHRKDFVPLRYRLITENQPGLIKLVVDSTTDRVLGIHVAGENAAEVVQAGAIAVLHGLTQSDLLHTMGVHPSTTEELFSL